jgi:hypothetical protein
VTSHFFHVEFGTEGCNGEAMQIAVVSVTRLPAAVYPQEDSWYSFLLRGLSRPRGHSAAGRINSIEKSSDVIGNPACSVVPQLPLAASNLIHVSGRCLWTWSSLLLRTPLLGYHGGVVLRTGLRSQG